MNNKILLESMALDLKRVALGAHSKSYKMADRFLQEVLKRNDLLDTRNFPKSLKKVLKLMVKQLRLHDTNRLADDALLYSTILISFSKKI